MSYLNYSGTPTIRGKGGLNSSETSSADPVGVVANVGAYSTGGTYYSTAYRYKISVEEVSTNTDTNSGVYNFYFWVKTNNSTSGWGWDWNWADTVNANFFIETDNGYSHYFTDTDVTSEYYSGINKAHSVPVNSNAYYVIAKVENLTLTHKEDGSLSILFRIEYGSENSTTYHYLPQDTGVEANFTATKLNLVPTVYAFNGTEWKKAKAIYAFNGTEWKKVSKLYGFNGSEWKKAK